MSKIKLFGVGREGNRVQFTLDKKQEFIPLIRKLLKKFVNDEDSIFLDIPGPKDDYDVRDEKIDSYTDTCVHRKYEDIEMDFFVGKDKIILVIRSSSEIQQKLVDFIVDYCEWIKL